MQRSVDMKELEARFEQVRRSEFFPAIMGAVAGGLTGAIMAGLISGGRRDGRPAADSKAERGVVLGFSAKDLLQLATVVAALARQLREWREQERSY